MSRIKSLYEPFQDWQKNGNIYIISDTHFEDEDRGFMGYKISEQEQINIINKGLYGKKSTLIILGDIGNPEWLKKIRCGRCILITGNHDGSLTKYEEYFDEIYDGPLLISPKIMLSHEPNIGLNWCYNIHGHDHSNWSQMIPNERLINLAGNVVNFEPFNLNDWANGGALKKIDNIHRLTIDEATQRKKLKEEGFDGLWGPAQDWMNKRSNNG